MKQKDIFTHIVKPTLKDFRKTTIIDQLYHIEDTYTDTQITSYSTKVVKALLVSDTIKNYKNDVLMAKIQYVNALKYYSILKTINSTETELVESNSFLCRMYLENVIIKLFSVYDKSFHILNTICDLRVDENIEKTEFKQRVRSELGNYNKKIQRRINSIFSRIKKHEFNSYRDNISHNRSDSFFRIIQDYKTPELKLTFKKGKSIEEIVKGIEEITNLINEQLIIINGLI